MSGGKVPDAADELVALWSILYTDPWYELRLLRNLPAEPVPLGSEPPGEALRRQMDTFTPSDQLRAELALTGYERRFGEALVALRSAPEFSEAISTAHADPLEHRGAIARALMAHALIAEMDAGAPAPDGAVRDALVGRLSDELGAEGMFVGDFLKKTLTGIAAGVATRKLTGNRGSLSDAATPAGGDVLRFLAAGDGVRRFVRAAIEDCGDGPVYLLAHSLGGMICADLLIREPLSAVVALVTAGSQTPFLYEIGAFPALAPPAPLPDPFPRWLNFYDQRDLLAYVCSGVFGDRVRDIEVDSGQPFPQSHSAYWSNRAVWADLADLVRE